MADQVQWRGGSRQNSDDFTGAPREVTVDTTDWILRVHDGIKPGGHKMMKVNDCLVVETADKCDPTAEECKVTVNGDLEVDGDTSLGDTVIDGNLVVNGDFLQGGITLAVKSDEVLLTNGGTWENPGGGCDILPDTGDMRVQEDANQYISRALAALENAICSFDLVAIDEIVDIKDDLEKILIAIAAMENRLDVVEADIEAIKARLDLVEQAIALLETEIEATNNNVTENAKAIEALKVLVAAMQVEIDDLAASIGDGKITIEDSTGVDIGNFTVNQKTPTTITLPAGFSGDYDDLANKPEINDGTMILESEGGTVYGSFSANEASTITISIPDPFSEDWADINNKPTEFPPADHTHDLKGLTDTNVPAPESGQQLVFRGGKWVAENNAFAEQAVHFMGFINVEVDTAPTGGDVKPGDAYIQHQSDETGATAGASWTGIDGEVVTEGQYVMYGSDNQWHKGKSVENVDGIQSDWDETDVSDPAYIQNKPDLDKIVVDGTTDKVSKVDTNDQNIASKLTIGTDKITLDATAGSATFASETMVGDIYNGGGTRFLSTGEVFVRNENTSSGAFEVYSGGTASANRTVSILAGGSAEFAGNVQSGGDAAAADTGAVLRSTGLISAARATGENIFSGFTAGDNIPKVLIKSDGSASFAGDVAAGERNPSSTTTRGVRIGVDSSNGGVYTQATGASLGSSLMAFQALHGTNENFKVMYDGTAEFAGRVTVPEIITEDDNAYFAGDYNNGGILRLTNEDANASSDAIRITRVGNQPDDATILLNYDGSATFESTVQVGGDPFPGAEVGFAAYQDGSIALTSNSGTGNILYGYTKGDDKPTSLITGSGEANFAGSGRFGDVSVGHTDLVKDSISIYPEKNAFGAAPVITGYDPSWAAPTFQFRADGSADFKGQVEIGNDIADASGTRIYNNGSVYVRHDSTQAGAAVWKSYNGGFGDANVKSAIYQDGSATFKGSVVVNSSDNTNSDYGGSFVNNKNASKWQAAVTARNTAAGGPVWCGLANDFAATDAGVTSTIYEDGSATFDGYIQSNRFSTKSALGTNVNNTEYAFAAFDVSSNLFASIGLDGSSTFEGRMDINGLSTRSGSVWQLKNSNGTGTRTSSVNYSNAGTLNFYGGAASSSPVVVIDSTTGNATFNGTVTSAGSFAIQTEADDDTKYTSTTDVDEEGNETVTRVYNGKVLDVKDRLTKTDTALKALKVAAAAATDFASLQSAIATALAKI